MLCRSVLVMILFTGGAFGSQCHPGWTLYRGSCYGFGETLVSWGDAMAICRTYDAKLAEPEDRTDNDFIKNMAKDKRADQVWIGGTDLFHEGTWEWVSPRRTIYNYMFSDWGSRQPDNDRGNEDCLTLEDDFGYQWNDANCAIYLNFICQGKPIQ